MLVGSALTRDDDNIDAEALELKPERIAESVHRSLGRRVETAPRDGLYARNASDVHDLWPPCRSGSVLAAGCPDEERTESLCTGDEAQVIGVHHGADVGQTRS